MKTWNSSTSLLAPLLLLTLALVVSSGSHFRDGQVSYIMEPFESKDDKNWFQSNDPDSLVVTLTSEGLFGNHALETRYSFLSSQEGSFGWLQSNGKALHNCHGAKTVSLWYKLLNNTNKADDETDTIFRLSFVDARNKTFTIYEEAIDQMHHEEQQENWQELVVSTADLPSNLNLRRIKGWLVQIFTKGKSTGNVEDRTQNSTEPIVSTNRNDTSQLIQCTKIDETSNYVSKDNTTRKVRKRNLQTSASQSGVILLDQLACNGGGDMFGSPFIIGNQFTLQQSIEEHFWMENYYQSNISQAQTRSSLTNGVLDVAYTLEQVESWGGFVDFAHLAPGPAYYNLSQATALLLDYTIVEPASVEGRSMFRFVIQDNSDCNATCDEDYHSHERYYSFHSILENDSIDTRKGTLEIPLIASTEPDAPFWLTGWSGINGNFQLDVSHLKGYTLELTLDSQSQLGELVTGHVKFSNLVAVLIDEEDGDDNGDQEDRVRNSEVSYVMEPFEFISNEWYQSPLDDHVLNLTVSSKNHSLFGSGALQVEYSFQDDNDIVEFGWLHENRTHNCFGANTFSIWYKRTLKGDDNVTMTDDRTLAAETEDRLRVSIVDDRGVSYTVFNKLINDYDTDWQELVVSATAFHMDLRRIKGWAVEITPKQESGEQAQLRSILLDQLACNGNGDLMGSFFHIGEDNFAGAIQHGDWMESYYQSNISKAETFSSIVDGVLAVNYTLEQVETWGGFADFAYLAPGSSYYNLSKATDLVLDYTILRPSSEPGRAMFRLVLQDNSHCNVTCDTDYHSHERYYSFNSILDLDENAIQQGQLQLPLVASTDPNTTFWLTGWSGIVGNSELDIDELKGFSFEFVLDSQLAMGSLVKGSVLMSNLASINIEPEDPVADSEISYVIEPFESSNVEWTRFLSSDQARLNLTISSEDALFGGKALRVDYSLREENDNVRFGWIQRTRPHNCFGAESFSIWGKSLSETENLTDRIRVSMLSENNTFVIFDEAVGSFFDEGRWEKISVPTNLFNMDLRRLKGWQVEIMRGHSETHDGNKTPSLDQVLLLDQLSCDGRGDMLGSVFHIGDMSFDKSIEEGTWMETYYQSNISKNESFSSMSDGILTVNYTIEMVESWGGFIDFAHLAPASSYYNLSKANQLMLDYDILAPSSAPGRAIFRLVLQDNSNCKVECDTDYHNHERYYSFHSILDFNSEDTKKGQLEIPLIASKEPETPFWLTGWSGIVGNGKFDLSEVKGFTFEFVLDSQLDVGSTVTGSVSMSNFAAAYIEEDEENVDETARCVLEPGLRFQPYQSSTTGFTRIEFLGNVCCETCAKNPDCVYALSTGRDCFIASSLEPQDIGLLNTQSDISELKSYWMDDASKRGDFCDLCECRESERIVDCRGRDLNIVPKTFDKEEWLPRTLDLRENPRLVILGSEALSSIGENLEELWVPKEMIHISKESIAGLPKLRTIHYEGDKNGPDRLSNAVVEMLDLFGDICCSRGEQVNLLDSNSSLTFCEMHVDRPGVDSVYEPFIYLHGKPTEVLFQSSPFMSEAAESVEKCAEYCTISADCNYFMYDARLPNAEHGCHLLEYTGPGGPDRVCCNKDHYADENQTIPGYISGRPPRTRHNVDNAALLVAPRGLIANEENEFHVTYEVSLGSTPLRGAVWITPVVVTSENTLNLTLMPPKIALYEANMTATFSVIFHGVGLTTKRSTVVIRNSIVACDAAFEWQSQESTTIFVDIEPPQIEEQTNYMIVVAVPLLLFAGIALILFLFYERQRKQNDAIWKVKLEELKFPDPPEIVGRGSFGLVLLAEYRGTKCAVKRAIPPTKKRKNNSGETFDSNSTRNNDDAGNALTVETQSMDGSSGHSTYGTRSGYHMKSGMASGMISIRAKSKSGLLSLRSILGKKPKSDSTAYKKLKTDFIMEMRYLSKLRHPCITTVMGAVIAKTVDPMLLMEYMEHGSLYDLLHNNTVVLEPEMILLFLRDITQGVRFLHSAVPQVIHGDLKAANILVDSKFRAKVSDFGLSIKHSSVGATGTPFWMAPELLRGKCTNNAATDIYSIGIMLYEVYSRRDPYEDEDPEEVLRLVADKKVQKRPPIPPSCPDPVQSLMRDCLSNEPSKRPTSEELDTRIKRIEVKNVEPPEKTQAKGSISLFDIFPRHIAEALSEGRKVEAEQKEVVTIFFSDIVGFTTISSMLPPRKVADMLDRLYLAFDDLATKHDIFKVETIGDAYMAVTNLVKDQSKDHAKRIAEFAIDALKAANTIQVDLDDPESGFLDIRVGFHSGPVVADVVGNRSPRYCLFGDTVNTASRMESNSKKNRIHCSQQSAKILREQWPELPLSSRGLIKIKGKGEMHTFWVNEEGDMNMTIPKEHPSSLIPGSPRQSPRRSPRRSPRSNGSRGSRMKGVTEESSHSHTHWDEHIVEVEQFISTLRETYFTVPEIIEEAECQHETSEDKKINEGEKRINEGDDNV